MSAAAAAAGAAPGAGGAAGPAAANAAPDAAPPPPPKRLARLAVFCGSRAGARPQYAQHASELGREMARRGIRLTYGGGTVGLMGVVARAVEDGFRAADAAAPAPPPPPPAVLGFIPELLAPRETTGELLGDTRVVPDMHVRKAAMAAHSDAFVALPGGPGTMEELFEVFTWQGLGFHQKPVGVLNTLGFYDGLRGQLKRMVDDDFMRAEVAEQLVVADDPVALLDALEACRPPPKTGLQLHVEQMMLAGSGTAVGVDISRPSGEAKD